MAKKTLDDVAARLAAAAEKIDEARAEVAALAAVAKSLSLTQTPAKKGKPEAAKGWATFAEWLREKLAAAELTEQRAAEMSGVPRGTLRNYLHAGRTPSIAAAILLARAFNFDLNELLEVAEYLREVPH